MPWSRRGKALAAIYLLAVVGSALVWAIHAYPPAVLLTVVLTAPWSLLGYVLLYVGTMAFFGISGGAVATVAGTALLLVLFPALAVANVFMAATFRRAVARRRIRRGSPTG